MLNDLDNIRIRMTVMVEFVVRKLSLRTISVGSIVEWPRRLGLGLPRDPPFIVSCTFQGMSEHAAGFCSYSACN